MLHLAIQAEDCQDGVDNDLDGKVDCADSDCWTFPPGLCPENCTDGIDNNQDGFLDCQDWDCIDTEACQEDCDDGLDNDLDGEVDCADPDCLGDLSCEEICDDGLDNDFNGETDCADSSCVEHNACKELCDGSDNDQDGLIGCDDPDCDRVDPCLEYCDDGIDNDGNGLTDCEDRDCWHDGGCFESNCEDGLDNDGDGLTDCEDERCQVPRYCEVDYSGMCTDGIDNDSNGLIDCEEAACFDAVGCIEDCTSSADDDNDGLLNCDDDDCWGDAACQVYTAQVLTGTYRYRRTYRKSRTRAARYLSYSDKPGAGRLLTYERNDKGFRGQINTSTDGLEGVLWVSSPAGAKQTCTWTLSGRSDSSFGRGSGYNSFSRSYYTSAGGCISTYRSNWVGSSPSHYAKSDAGNLVFSSACGLPSSHKRIAIEKAPLNNMVQSSTYGSSTTPYSPAPTSLIGSCGFSGSRSSSSSVYRFVNNRYVYNIFGASSTTWQF